MPTLRRYCWRIGSCVTLDDEERCDECGAPGSRHKPAPIPGKCCAYAAITSSKGGPCILEIGHEGPHVAHPEQVQSFVEQGAEVELFKEEP